MSGNDAELVAAIGRAAEPFEAIDDPAFAALFDRFADARVVLLGEASHGSSEFYAARAAITRRLDAVLLHPVAGLVILFVAVAAMVFTAALHSQLAYYYYR